jgi:hypothetical protein
VRFVHIYLLAYFVLVMGAGLALWQAGILARVPPLWIALAGLAALVLGILLPLTSAAPPQPLAAPPE